MIPLPNHHSSDVTVMSLYVIIIQPDISIMLPMPDVTCAIGVCVCVLRDIAPLSKHPEPLPDDSSPPERTHDGSRPQGDLHCCCQTDP
jgi:hypothetical protein